MALGPSHRGLTRSKVPNFASTASATERWVPMQPRVVHRPTSSGWTTAAVAVTSTPPPRTDRREWHGQEGQDRIVATLLGSSKQHRYFIDLASSGGWTHSNTKALERDWGWRGLCIEANSAFWPSLVNRRTCEVVGAAVAEKRAEMGFHKPVIQGMGGLVGGPRHILKNAHANASMRVQAVPLAEVFRQFRVPPAIQHGQTALARSRPCGHPPPQEAHLLARGRPPSPREEPSPLESRKEAATALWRLPTVAELPAFGHAGHRLPVARR